ncbi:MAG: putative LPS assembly protein LptD [Raineya sp.]
MRQNHNLQHSVKLAFANIKLLKDFFVVFVLSLTFSLVQAQDSLRISVDSIKKLNKPAKDTLPKSSQSSDLRTTVKFAAKDSVKLNVKKKKAAMYEKAQIDYGETQLKSARIFLDLNSQIVQARPKFDTANKRKMLDKPFLKEKKEEFTMDSVDYNLETQKGLIFNIVTKQGEGFVAGTRVKKDENNELCIRDGHYTTCDLAHPHFRIVAKKIKVTKGQNIVAGPFYLEVGDVPTPLGFAFGIFPKPKEKTSGIIIPEYGEARENGFFLRGGGYYWAISDYVDARFTGEIYTYGNWGVGTNVNYQKRYAFRGGLNFSYRSLFDNPLDEFNRKKNGQFNLSWNHSPETKGTGRFSASANIASAGFNRTSVTNINSLIQTNLNSAITYSKTFKGLPFALSLAGRHQQELSRNEVTINLPDVNFTMNQVFPFKSLVKNPKSFLSTIGINYALNGSNSINNRIQGTNFPFATTERRNDSIYRFRPEFFGLFLQNARINLSHSSNISAPFKLFKYFNGSLGLNLSQTFHQRRFRYSWEESFDATTQTYRGAVRVDTLNRWGSTYRYSFSTSLGTNVYGFYNFPKLKGRLQTIRHTLIPNISFSYTPDFSQARFGFYQNNVQTGIKNVRIGENQVLALPRFEDLPIFESSPNKGRSGSIGISLRNIIEAKLRPKSDSANAKPEKINLLDELSFNTSYNMLADRNKGQYAWANVSMNTRVRLFKKIDIALNGVIDPYLYRDTLLNNQIQKVKTFDLAWSRGSVGKLTNANLSFATFLNPDFFKKGGSTTTSNTSSKMGRGGANTDLPNTLLNPMANAPGLQTNTIQNPFNDVNRYVDFDVTWNLTLSYNLSLTRLPTNTITQTLTFTGDINLTKNWKLNFNSNYDFKNKGFGPSQFSFIRNLHCWQMSFDWQPFGQFQSYFFRLNANASTLKDLKVERRRTQYDR